MPPYACVPKIPIAPGKLHKNVELMQRVVKNAKSHDTEPGCQAYFFFVPKDGSEEFLYGVEIYDDEKAIKDTHFNSRAFQSFAAEGQKEGVNPGPPEINFGYVLGGWRTRAGEGKRIPENEIILFAKYTLLPGKRAKFQEVLLEGLSTIDKDEPGTLSILLIEDDSKEDVTYVMERFKDQSAMDAHMNGSGSSKVMPVVKECVKSRDGGAFKYLTGFISKDE